MKNLNLIEKELPEVVITPNYSSSLAKRMIPDDNMRAAWYEYGIPENVGLANYINRIFKVWKDSGMPKVKPLEGEYNFETNRAHYMPATNTIYLHPQYPLFVDELAHAFQRNASGVPHQTIRNIIDNAHGLIDPDWKNKPQTSKMRFRYVPPKVYETPLSYENTAHSIMQPLIERYASKEDPYFNLDNLKQSINFYFDNYDDRYKLLYLSHYNLDNQELPSELRLIGEPEWFMSKKTARKILKLIGK